MSFHLRRLPHWYPSGKALFLTWHLHGSIPQHRRCPLQGLTSGKAFVWLDRLLDRAETGPQYLRNPELAAAVVRALYFGQEQLNYYQLHAWVVMANHVHVLLTPKVDPARLMKSIKGFTAREGNRILGRTGEPFWERETYDHWVRDGEEWTRIKAYIEKNPVKAGLVERPEDYSWSSAAGTGVEPVGKPVEV